MKFGTHVLWTIPNTQNFFFFEMSRIEVMVTKRVIVLIFDFCKNVAKLQQIEGYMCYIVHAGIQL